MINLQYFELKSARSILLLIARVLLVALFLISGRPKLIGFEGTVSYMQSLHAPFPVLAAAIAVLMEVSGSFLILLGFFTRPMALIFAFYTLGTAIIGHAYWNMTGDAVHPNMLNFYKNISIIGGFILLAFTGPGSISLDKE